MKVFLSWSDSRSKLIAEALRGWLPKVLQSVKPWMSDEDISAGAQWLSEISQSLDSCSIGIICVTPENQHNPWLQFEAGALSKTLEQTCVCPLVYDMTLGQLSGPLTQFQGNELTKQGMLKVLTTLNKNLPDPMEVNELEEILDVWWERLENKLNSIPQPDSAPKIRTVNEQLDELLELSREQIRRENLRLERSLNSDKKLEKMISHLDNAGEYLQTSRNNIENIVPDILTKALSAINEGNPESATLNTLSQIVPEFLSSNPSLIPDTSQLQELAGELKDFQREHENHVNKILNPEEK